MCVCVCPNESVFYIWKKESNSTIEFSVYVAAVQDNPTQTMNKKKRRKERAKKAEQTYAKWQIFMFLNLCVCVCEMFRTTKHIARIKPEEPNLGTWAHIWNFQVEFHQKNFPNPPPN